MLTRRILVLFTGRGTIIKKESEFCKSSAQLHLFKASSKSNVVEIIFLSNAFCYVFFLCNNHMYLLCFTIKLQCNLIVIDGFKYMSF